MSKLLNSFDQIVNFRKSPLFYVGDKFKLMPKLRELFPSEINNYYEPFCGGGSSFLNINAKRYFLNDIDTNLINLHKFLLGADKDKFFNDIFKLIKKYNLSNSFKNYTPPDELKNKFKKTYFAVFNKENYIKLKNDFNADKNDILRLYLLLIYGFNHMFRFNAKGEFNLPVGNVDFNKNVVNALNDYFDFIKERNLIFSNLDFEQFLGEIEFKKGDFVYFDPPYLISSSEYNKFWSKQSEIRLYYLLDKLDQNGVSWGLSNLLIHKNQKNELLEKFMKKYQIYQIKSNYISFNDNSIKNSVEVFVKNEKRI